MVDGGRDVHYQVGNGATTIERHFNGRQQAYSYDAAVWPSIDPIDQLLLVAYGNKARANVNPTNPATQTGTGLGELRDVNGVPSIPGLSALKERVSILRAAGREYLNVEFGWKPLESDVRNAALEVKRSVKLLRQYEKSRGQQVRRRFSFDPINTVTTTDMGASHAAVPPVSTAFFDTYFGRLSLEQTFKQQVWFSGCFTYYVSPGMNPSKLGAYEAAADRLLGSRLTPELIWNLTPWTWLSDWFVDIGDVVNGIQALVLDGSVMWYGYVMASQYRENMYTLSGVKPKGENPMTLSQRFIAETKQRQKATPFGFGLDPSGFSGKQWAILAALGISRIKW
jgi:hypothetical protein